ncbi:unnamed protein product [Ectocarpus sp. 12 AP-2014]
MVCPKFKFQESPRLRSERSPLARYACTSTSIGYTIHTQDTMEMLDAIIPGQGQPITTSFSQIGLQEGKYDFFEFNYYARCFANIRAEHNSGRFAADTPVRA